MQWRSTYATTAGALAGTPPAQGVAPARHSPGSDRRNRQDWTLDLRRGGGAPGHPGRIAEDRAGRGRDDEIRIDGGWVGPGRGDGGRDTAVRALCYPAGDVLVVSGLPGSGKSTLIKRTVAERGVRCVDSQAVRERFERRMPRRLSYALYRPVVRLAHYYALFRAMRARESLVVHDCGSIAWVRRWVADQARRQKRGMHLLLLDVPPQVAEEGQRARGREVSARAFARHRRASARLISAAADIAQGVEGTASGGSGPGGARRSALPEGCVSAVLIDRWAAGALQEIRFADLGK